MNIIDSNTRDVVHANWHHSSQSRQAATPIWLEHDQVPASAFLQVMVEDFDLVLHGSNRTDLSSLKPARAFGVETDQALEAVYATDSAAEALFFAILDRSVVGSFSSTTYGTEYAVDKFTDDEPWCDGAVYLADGAAFERVGGYYVCTEPVAPVAALSVIPSDFPYLDLVQQERLPSVFKWVFRCVMWWQSMWQSMRHSAS